MRDFNQAILIGTVNGDVTSKEVGGTPFASFRVESVEEREKEGTVNRYSTWLTCVAWGRRAEQVTQEVKTGQRIFVRGSIRVRTYDKEGEKRVVTEISIAEFDVLTKPGQRADDRTEDEQDDLPF